MRKCRHYTLIELVAVIMMLLLVTGIAITQFRKMPVFISLDRTVNQVKNLCSEARSSACCQGKEITVTYFPETRRLSINTAVNSELILPEGITLGLNGEELDSDKEKHELFKFYPDGSGMEQDIVFKLNKHKIRFSVSPLTGGILSKEAE